MGCKKQVLNARGGILDAIEMLLPFSVTRGAAVVNACDNHKRRTRNEAGKVLFEFRLCELLSNIFIEDKVELPAL